MKKTKIVERVGARWVSGSGRHRPLVGAVIDSIGGTLARGEDVSTVGFGRISRNDRPAREGRNARTGEQIPIGPSAGVAFKTGKPLKDALN